jgi:2-hydroxy-3-keto-5-methylthiopentenyl-1-phosphate phosphatase
MYLVEKIGQLVLITLEGLVKDEEIENIKIQLKKVSDKEGVDEVVVSLSTSPPESDKTTPDMQKRMQEIIEFCNEHGIRIYSYRH